MEAVRRKPAKAVHKKTWILVVASVAIALVIAAVVVSQFQREQEAERQAIIQANTFHPGVQVSGVDVSGMTKGEAMEALRPAEAAMREEAALILSFKNEAQDFTFTVDASAFGLSFNTSAVLDEALSLARDGSLKELEAELLDIATAGRVYEIGYTASTDSIQSFAREIADEVNTPSQDAGFIPLVTPAPKPGTTPEGSPAPSPTPAPTPTPKLEEDEENAEGEAATPAPQTAADMGFFRYETDVEGLTVDQEALVAMLLDMAENRSYADADIPMHREPAAITLEQLQQQTTLRSHASTSFAKSPYYRDTRVFNMRKAASLINGIVVEPGQEFSTNGALGNRTYELGWQGAPAIVRGRNEDQAGGGVCQISSTLYHAVLKADLEIVYRQGHSGRLGYVEGGLDATIDSGRIDFKWKNNTDQPLTIFCWLDETNRDVYVELYGAPLPYDEIQLSSERVRTLDPPGEMTYQYDYSLDPGETEVYVSRKSGSIWQSYATYIKDGEVVEKKEIAETTYDAYAGVTLVGPPIGEIMIPNMP